ncbi:MAG: flagellar basal-body MS-ring/collar protein FliF [Motilibacteraceae bacterium]
MGQNLLGAARRAGRTFGDFTLGQKVVTVLAVIGLALGALLFNRWASTPTYAPLFSNLAASDASAIVDKLNSAGTPYKLANGGSTILVPQGQVDGVRLQMSGQGLPASDSSSWALLDKQGMTSSQFQQQVAYQRALEGELAKTIQSIQGVDAAVVNLAIPQKDVFTKESDKPTASVLVRTKAGQDLTSQQVQAVTNLVASSVPGLTPDMVTVADGKGRVLSAQGTAGGAGADTRGDQTRSYEDRMSQSLQDMLDRVVGPGHSVVRLTADLDYDSTDTTTEKYVYDKTVPPVASSTTTEKWSGAGGTAVGGVLGPDNISVPAGSATPGANTYQKDSATVNNAVGKVVEQRKSAPGTVRKLNVAVLLDTRTAGTIDPAQVQALVASAAGITASRGDTIQVSRMPFDQSAEKDAQTQLAEAKKAEQTASRMSLIKTGGLVGLVVLVVLYALLAGRKRRKAPALSPEERLQIEALQRSLELANVQPAGELTGTGNVAIAALDPAPAPDPAAQLAALARDEIGQLVQQQPEEVAQLLRGWLADRRG